MRLRRKIASPPRQRPRLEAPSPPPAFSYHARRDERPEDNARKQPAAELPPRRHQRRKLNKTGIRAGSLLIIVAAAYLLYLGSSVSVRILGDTPAGLTQAGAQAYTQAAQAALSHSPLNHTKLTVNTQQVTKQLRQQFPATDSITIRVPFIGNHLQINVVPAQPALVLAAANGNYFIDGHGKAVAALTGAANNLHLPIITDQSNLAVALNKQMLTPEQVHFVQVVGHQLAARQFAYGSMVLPPSATELDVSIKDQPYIVKFNLEAPDTARQQVGTFLAVRQSLAGQHITPAKYIDVRVQGRAYYQ